MAFNPFHKFRKHQRVIFAGLTILCMMTFVLCSGLSGGGDFAGWIQSVMTGTRRGPQAATIYGKKVTLEEINETIFRRQIANTFMTQATYLSMDARARQIQPPGQPMTPEMSMRLQMDPQIRLLSERWRNQPYFGGNLKNTDDILYFMIWLRQADQLDIKLSKADVNKEISRLTLGLFDQQASGIIEQSFRNDKNYRGLYNSDLLVSALTDEFRVRLAQEAMLGFPNRIPTAVTPDEFYEYFKDQRTNLQIGLVPVKVEDFLADVKEEPTEKELKELYDKYKNEEWTAQSATPGFKQPRRVSVEWVAGKQDSEFYKKATANFGTVIDAVQLVAGAGSGAPLGGLTTPFAITAPLGANYQLRLEKAYEDVKWRKFQMPSWTKEWRVYNRDHPLHDSSFNDPLSIAATVGQSIALPEAAALTAANAYLGGATLQEMQARVVRGTTWLLAGAKPAGPLSAAAIASELTPRQEYLPLSQVKAQVEEEMSPRLTQDILAGALKNVQKEIETLAKGEKRDEKIKEYLAKAVKEFDLQTGKTEEPRDRNKRKFNDDPGLKAFLDAYTKAPSEDPTGKDFGDLFLPERQNPDFEKRPYQIDYWPKPFRQRSEIDWQTAPEKYIYWKTEDRPAKVVGFDDPEVKKEVVQAWRYGKARELAKKKAEALEKLVQEKKGDIEQLRDFSQKETKKPLIELAPMAKKMRNPSGRAEADFVYDFPQVPEDKVPNAGLMDGGRGFANKLMGLKEKSIGDTIVLSDAPEGVYYVASLLKRTEPNPDEFFRIYRASSSKEALNKDPLLVMFEQEKQSAYIRSAVEKMRKDANIEINKEVLKDTGRNTFDD